MEFDKLKKSSKLTWAPKIFVMSYTVCNDQHIRITRLWGTYSLNYLGYWLVIPLYHKRNFIQIPILFVTNKFTIVHVLTNSYIGSSFLNIFLIFFFCKWEVKNLKKVIISKWKIIIFTTDFLKENENETFKTNVKVK